MQHSVFVPGSVWEWEEQDGTRGSLLFFEQDLCELVLDGSTSSASCTVSIDGDLTVKLSKGTYRFTIGELKG